MLTSIRTINFHVNTLSFVTNELKESVLTTVSVQSPSDGPCLLLFSRYAAFSSKSFMQPSLSFWNFPGS